MTEPSKIIQGELASAESLAPTPPSADFDAAWAAASLDAGAESTGHEATGAGPSTLTTLASQQTEQLENALAAPDLSAVSQLPVLQMSIYTAHMINKKNLATAQMNIVQGLVKDARQSLDTLMNSK